MLINTWMQRWSQSRFKLPALSGVLLAAIYYGPLPVAQWIAFLPILFWLDSHRSADIRTRFSAGVLFGLSAHLITLHFWFTLLDVTWLVILLYLLLAGLFALKIALSMTVLGWLRRRSGLSFALLLPAVWLPVEWLGSLLGDLRWTADHIAYSLSAFPFLVQFADLVGPYGVGALILVINGLLFEVLFAAGAKASGSLAPRDARPRALVALAAVCLVVLGYDAWAWSRPDSGEPTVRVALVQPNIGLAVKMSSETASEQWERLEALTRRAAADEPDLIVWPESASPYPLVHATDRPATFRAPELQALARDVGVPLLVGAEYYQVKAPGDFKLYNAAIVAEADGTLRTGWAGKRYLVPFAEALPFRNLFGRFIDSREGDWRWIAGAFSPGPRDVILQAGGSRVGVLVCFEQMFDVLSRGLRNAGAEFQVVMTNDAWWDRTVLQDYLANALRLRAIENRTDIVRVANTGISGFVDQKGRYHRRTQLFVEAVDSYEVHRSTERTLYTRTGNVIMLFPLITLAWAVFRSTRDDS
jgi:apolipoprotein N-acyltransferase